MSFHTNQHVVDLTDDQPQQQHQMSAPPPVLVKKRSLPATVLPPTYSNAQNIGGNRGPIPGITHIPGYVPNRLPMPADHVLPSSTGRVLPPSLTKVGGKVFLK